MRKYLVPQEDPGTDRARSNILPLTFTADTLCRLLFYSIGNSGKEKRHEQAQKKDQTASVA